MSKDSNKMILENINLKDSYNLTNSDQNNNLSNEQANDYANFMHISNNKDWIRFQQWRSKKVNAVSVLNPEVPVLDHKPTKQRTRINNVELLMYRGTERSKINDKDESKKRENVNISPLKGQHEINIKIFNKEDKKSNGE